jgi:hypothetical protein
MKHVINRAVDFNRLGDIVLEEAKLAILGQMLDISQASRQQVVNTEDLVPLRQETFAKMRPDESSPPGDHGSHGCPPDFG